ncbi:MAG: hypothetical protein HGB18_03000 [Candidatus Moranbacteria bacterium]|nr:hypothetical protein [Candidatus Moranbacteria bacterium]
MSKEFPSPESKKVITKEDVINIYRKFIDRGIKDPEALNSENDPEVREAHELYFKYLDQLDALAQGDEEAELRNNVFKTLLYIDAGFDDPEYLDKVLNNWLVRDAERAEKLSDNPERAETRRQTAEAMNRVRALLAKNTR